MVVPVSAPASTITVIFAVPLKLVPLIVLAVSNAVAVAALPVILVWSPVLLPLTVASFDAVSVLPAAIVKVPVPVVMKLPLILVAVAAPIFGVVKTGDVARTTFPEPVVEISSTTPAPVVTLPSTLSFGTYILNLCVGYFICTYTGCAGIIN